MAEAEVTEVEEEVGNDLMSDLADAWPAEEAEPVEAVEATEKEEPVEQETEAASEEAVTETEAPDDSAPPTASIALREAWKDLPDTVKSDYVERERRHSTELQKNAEKANFAQSMMGAISPFQNALQMEGNSPQEAVRNLAQIAHGLRNGTPSEKATMMANLIQRYGVDIIALDGALVGEQLPQEQPQQQQEFRDPRVDQLLQQQNMQRAQDATQNIQTWAQTAKAEFISDAGLRNDMADLMDMATNRGQEMSLQQAYDKACLLNPQVQQAMEQRKLAEDGQRMASKNNAASSISGAPQGSPGGPDVNDMRAVLEHAWRES